MPAATSQIAETTDAVQIIARVASASRQIRERYADLIRVMLSTAPHDQAVAEQYSTATAVRRAALVLIAERLARLGALRPGADVAYAAEVLWFYFGYTWYFTLVDDNGWSNRRAEHWLSDQARRELLSPPVSSGVGCTCVSG